MARFSRRIPSPGTALSIDTWRGAMVALNDRVAELARGELLAPGATGEKLESALADERLDLAPSCTYCGLLGLCGRAGAS